MGRFRVRQKHSQHTRDVSGALCISRHHKDVRCTALTGYRVRQWKKLPHKCRHVLERTFPLKRVCLGHACGRHTCLLKLKIAQLGKSFALRRAQKVCLDVGRLLRHRQRRFGLLLSYRRLFSALRFGMLATLALFLRGCIYSIRYRKCLLIVVGLGDQMLVQQEPIVQVVAHEALGSGGGTFLWLTSSVQGARISCSWHDAFQRFSLSPSAMVRRSASSKFPIARIKRIMQADEDVGKVAQATPVVICTCGRLTWQPKRSSCLFRTLSRQRLSRRARLAANALRRIICT